MIINELLVMNASSLYVSTCRLIIQSNLDDQSSWCDLYRLLPYLRQSLSCTVCGSLLIDPQTPTDSVCQHHVCKQCKWGRKKLKPSCNWCFDYNNYNENIQLRILLQCYKKLCEYLMSTQIYRHLVSQADVSLSTNSMNTSASGLIEFIQEGVDFTDDFKSTSGLTKSAYSILPCVYTNSSTQTNTSASVKSELSPQNNDTSANSNNSENSLYSVMYAGTGNKITIKRKPADNKNAEEANVENVSKRETNISPGFKKPTSRSRVNNKRKGCRCGNATATPGKLTCCGQRCPCYVESKPCLECKCRGCRNPHRPNGFKVRPHIPQLQNLQRLQKIDLPENDVKPEIVESPSESLHLNPDEITLDDSIFNNMEIDTSNIQVVGVYTHLQEIGSNLPTTILMEDSLFEDDHITSQGSSNEASDIEVDV